MNTESLKQVLEALNGATAQAKEAFYVYLCYNFMVDVLIVGTIIFSIVFLAKWVRSLIYNHDILVKLYMVLRKQRGLEPTNRVWEFEVEELIDELQKK